MSTEASTLHIVEIPYPSGNVKQRYSRVLAPDGKQWIRHGLFVAYDENGKVTSEVTYLNGLENGRSVDYYENGQIAAEGNYSNGKEQGIWRFFRPDGTPEKMASFLDGEETEI